MEDILKPVTIYTSLDSLRMVKFLANNIPHPKLKLKDLPDCIIDFGMYTLHWIPSQLDTGEDITHAIGLQSDYKFSYPASSLPVIKPSTLLNDGIVEF